MTSCPMFPKKKIQDTMASLQDADPSLREYILKHSLTQIYQALLTALCVSCPESPLHFIQEKILELQGRHHSDIKWYTCLDMEQIPVSSFAGRIMYDIFENADDILIISHLFEKAYSFYRRHLTETCFMGWKRYISLQRMEAAMLLEKMAIAERHWRREKQRSLVFVWADYVRRSKKRQNEAVIRIQRVCGGVLCKLVISAWHFAVQDSKEIKQYFQRLESDVVEMSSHSQTDNPQMEGKDELSMLPSKLSLKIFQGLGVGDLLNCAQVCRTWMSITQNCSLWSQINFSDYKTWISDSMVKKILQKYRMFVSRLNMRGCTSLQESSFKCISECRNLQELNLSECCNINDEVVQMIAENCPSLLYLNLSYTTVTDATFRALSRCCLNLQYVSLAYCRKFTDKGLQCLTIGMGCRRIVYLDLSGCTQITVMGFRHIGEGCRLLQHVVFNDMPTLSDRCVKELTSKCHCLISISLLDSIHVSDSALKAISDVAHLSQFEIEGNSQITDAGWKDLCRSSPKLQLLRVADCPNMTDISMKSIGSLKKLTYLDISGCESMSDVGLRAITEGHSASRIQELHLSSCICISDLSMMWIAQRCSKLSNLNLCYCQNLTDSGFELLAGCLSLVSLDITGCNISDQGLVGLGGSQSLKKLNISECIWISDIGVENFCALKKDLEELDMSCCITLTDQAIKGLSYHCRAITSVKMAGCPGMSDTAIQYLLSSGHFLRELDISGCIHLTDRAARFLHRGCKQLRFIKMLHCRGISRHAALRLKPCVQQWEYSNDDVPHWYSYKMKGSDEQQSNINTTLHPEELVSVT